MTKLVTASTMAAGAASAARPSGVGVVVGGALVGGAFAGGAAAGVPAGAWPARGAAPPPVGP